MKPAVDSAPDGGPHAHTDPMAAAIADRVLAYLRSRPEAVEPISVDAETAAKLVGCCSKTLGAFPAEQTGKVKLNRRVVYELARLRQFVRDRIGTEN